MPRSSKPAKPAPTKPAAERRVRRSPEEAKAHLLEIATELLAVHGPDGIGLKDVARAAGTSHSLISHYFGTWDRLVEEAIRGELARTRNAFAARVLAAPTLEPEAWLENVFDNFASPRRSRLLLWAVMSGRADQLAGPDGFPRRDQGLRFITDVLETRIAAAFGGRKPPRDDLESAVVLTVATTWGYLLGRPILWAALGQDADASKDRAIRSRLLRSVWRDLMASAEAAEPPTAS